MANVKSTEMAAFLANPPTLVAGESWNAPTLYRGFTVPVAAADVDGTIYVLGRFKVGDGIVRLLVTNTAITVGTDYDCGIYAVGAWVSDSAPKDADIIFDGVDMSAARDVQTDLVGVGAGAINAADYGKALWQWAGDALRPDDVGDYDLCLTANVVGTASGTIIVQVWYTTEPPPQEA